MTGTRSDPAVIVIGAGMTGIMLVIKLRQAGISNVLLLEKAETLGGTWRENTYPGVSCDVPSHAYAYSFEPNPDWSSMFAAGAEIQQYFTHVFHKYGLDACTRFNEAVTACRYVEGRWQVSTSQGHELQADLLFAATGMLHQPVLPEIEGMDDYGGKMFHTARWDHGVSLAGKRIGVIGNGSSGAQLLSALVEAPDTTVTVFQRTPQWIIKTSDRVYSEADKARFRRQPFRMQVTRALSLTLFKQSTKALTNDGLWDRMMHRLFAWNGRRYLEQSIRDPLLREKLTPDYKFGCKRVIMNDTFYTAIQQPNARLVTEGIARMEADGVRTADGELHELDIVVLATGFDPAAYMRPMEFVGRDGLTIDQAWEKKIQAYRSLLLSGFPNFFLMLGPNSPIGNNSVISLSEIQSDYALQLIDQWRDGTLDAIEVTPEATASWNAMLKSKIKSTVWASGCNSWYLDDDGDPLVWPDKWSRWMDAMSDIDLKDFASPT